MIRETNHYFGSVQPSEYEYVDGGIMHCENIHQTDGAWYADISIVLEGDDAYAQLVRHIELKRLCDEHDELIAELIEGGNA